MFLKIWIALPLVIAIPVWSQVAPSVTGNLPTWDDRMQTPPPVSGQSYPTTLSEGHSNYIRAGFAFSIAYNDNLLLGSSSTPISDVSYSIWPTISMDQTTGRMHQLLAYDPGFTFYQHTSGWNEQSQYLNYDSQYSLTPYITLSVQDQFLKSSNMLNQSGPLSDVRVSGSVQTPINPLVAPFADQLSNTASTELTDQFSRNDMVGGSGFFYYLHYSNPEQVSGLYDSSSRGGTGFYNHRVSAGQYIGAIYQYVGISDKPPSSQGTIEDDIQIQTNAVSIFYTIYLQSHLSLSFSLGPQRYNVIQPPLPETHGWFPTFAASLGWQGQHTALAGSYSQEVGGAGGLSGAYHTKAASASFQWQIERAWAVGAGANYFLTSNVSSAMAAANPGGSSVSGTFAIHHAISEHIYLDFGYTRLHQDYEAVSALSSVPNSDRIYATLSYQFLRPLGR